jgi:RNA polymerase sigma-70 factor (ECF subfamily)
MADDCARMDVAQLVAEHYQAVYRYAYRLSGLPADAEDLTQQTFLVAQRKLPQLREDANARSWLFTVLRNCFLKERERRRPVPAVNLHLSVDNIPVEVPKEEEIDRQQLQEALDQLSEDFRLVLVMFYFEDRSYREIAEELELPIGTVMSRLARGKAFLRSKLFEPAMAGPRRPHASSTQRV